MNLEDMARVVSRAKLIQAGYHLNGNYMESIQFGKTYRFINVTENDGYVFDGVTDVGLEKVETAAQMRQVPPYDNNE